MSRSVQVITGIVAILALIIMIWAMSADSPYIADYVGEDAGRPQVYEIENPNYEIEREAEGEQSVD